ncbi:MAG: DoxX family protein [Marmoricola sp.]|nr:DoxX family protein [Marmoricola sp.]
MHDLDFGLALLRLALGPMLVLHGLNKAFGPNGFAGTEGWFESLGLRPAWLHARLASGNEIVAGTLLTLGLFTGLAATAFVGLMLVATFTDHRGKGYFVFKGGCEYTVLIAMIAIAIAALGPGEWSLDNAFNLDLAGGWWAVVAAVGGAAAAAGLLITFLRPNKETS